MLFFDRKPAQEKPWICDLHTNKHFALKENTLNSSDLDDFVGALQPAEKRTETERFKWFTYDELLKHDKMKLDVFWLKDEALQRRYKNPRTYPDPDVVALEISEDLEAALEQFAAIAEG